VHQLPDAGPAVGLQGPYGALQPSLAFVEFTRPGQVGRQRDQRGRDDGLPAPAMPAGERNRLAAALPGRAERADLRRESQLRQAGESPGSGDDVSLTGGEPGSLVKAHPIKEAS